MRNLLRFRSGLTAAIACAMVGTAAFAGDNSDPTFGSRTDKPDGSSSLTIGRKLSSPWDTKIGTDISLAAPVGTVTSDYVLNNGSPDRSTGSVWGNLTMQHIAPPGFDKTSVEARVDPGKDEGKLGATVSRSLPINPDLSITLQNSTSIKQALTTSAAPAQPSTATPLTAPPPSWGMDDTVRLSVDQLGTTFSAGATSSGDTQWHNKLSVEQTLFGPLKLTTSVEDAGTSAPKKSITAGFKRSW